MTRSWTSGRRGAILSFVWLIHGEQVKWAASPGIALRCPHLVRKLLLAAISYDRSGLHRGILDGIKQLSPRSSRYSPRRR